MKRFVLFVTALSLFSGLFAQEEEKKFGIKFSGFVKNDAFFDSRQTVSVREGHFLLYPQPEELDADENDINAVPNFNILAIQTRLKGSISGPDAFGAKTSGAIEGAFFGHTNADINGFRLRHAFMKLKWESTELILGQYWHPFFVTGCFPGVISFNTGVPFQPFSRNPQMRLTKYFGDNLSVMLALQSQRDFTSSGGSTALRNSSIPDLQFQVQYRTKNEEAKTEFLAGAGAGYKILKPELSSTVYDTLGNPVTYQSEETIGGISGLAFVKYKNAAFTAKVEGVYGQNMTDLLMLGGYAQMDQDTTTGIWDYTTLDIMSFWTDIHTNGKKLQAGLFAGYTMNMGSANEFTGGTFARGTNIEYVYRVSPRVVFISGKTKLALEAEYTTAAYGTPNETGEVENAEEISNLRVLFGAFYSF